MRCVFFCLICLVVALGVMACAKKTKPAQDATTDQPDDLPAFLVTHPETNGQRDDTVVLGTGKWDSQSTSQGKEGEGSPEGGAPAPGTGGSASPNEGERQWIDEGTPEWTDEGEDATGDDNVIPDEAA